MRNSPDNLFLDLYASIPLVLTDVFFESEGKEYEAARFNIGSFSILSRRAKITPTKTGQFVTCWQRNSDKVTAPFPETSEFDFLCVLVLEGNKKGVFAFSKEVLIEKGIFSSAKLAGKRGFRVYPSWCEVESKQALQSQQWQLQSFYDVSDQSAVQGLKNLFV